MFDGGLEQTRRLEALERLDLAQQALTAAVAEVAQEPYTVADLRNDIKDADGSLTIDLEGCDCFGKCSGVVIEAGGLIMERA